jgi:hypothetical protein
MLAPHQISNQQQPPKDNIDKIKEIKKDGGQNQTHQRRSTK